jgi:hypothetical protein
MHHDFPRRARTAPNRLDLLLALFASAACLVGVPLYAETVSHRFVSGSPVPALEEILYLAMGVELSNAGYSSTRVESGADFTLETAYEVRGEEAEVRLALFASKEPGRAIAEDESRMPIDYELDAAAAAAVRRLLERAQLGQPSEGAPRSEIDGLFPSSLITVEDTLRTTRTLRPDAQVSAGGTLFLDEFADYVGYGATGTLQGGALLLRRTWSFSVGPRITVTRGFNKSGVDGGPFYLSTAGLNAQYGVGTGQANRLSVGVSGGAAVLSLLAEGGALHKTVPYADAGIQASIPLGKDFFLGGDVRFLLVFDPDVLIMGAAPTVSLCKEF